MLVEGLLQGQSIKDTFPPADGDSQHALEIVLAGKLLPSGSIQDTGSSVALGP